MKRSNTAIILILRDHMIPFRIADGVPQVQAENCIQVMPVNKNAWINVPDIISALWVVGKMSTLATS